MTRPRVYLLVALLGLGSVSEAAAASITWEPPHNITSPADVSTDGFLVAALNLGSSATVPTTVNGVPFQSVGVPNFSTSFTVGQFAFQSSGSVFVVGGSGSIQLPSVGPAYANLLYTSLATWIPVIKGGGLFGGSCSVTISGLIAGVQYELQWWANDSSTPLGPNPPHSNLHTATAGNTVVLADNLSGRVGGLGQYATGRFVADSPVQMITFSGGGFFTGAYINALQLRASQPIPENGSTLLTTLLSVAAISLPQLRRAVRSLLSLCLFRS